MQNFFDWLISLPKGILIAVAVVLFAALGFGVYKVVLGGDSQPDDMMVAAGPVLLEMPDATFGQTPESRLEAYRKDDMDKMMSASDFWNQLGDSNQGGLLVGDNGGVGGSSTDSKNIYLDPSIYSELEIYYIRNGTRTKEEVDAEHAAIAKENAEIAAELRAKEKRREEANSDSAYFARMEKAYEMAMKYSGESQAEPQPEDDSESREEEELARIDIPEQSYIPESAMGGDGIISSLESEQSGLTYQDGEHKITPVRATFLKTEQLVAGQRVIMRLIDDMRLEDGVVVPANTHVTGICSVGSRLKIDIKTVNYGGRIYRVDMNVYDNDGTEGIYCPIINKKKGKKVAGEIASEAVSGVASTAATLFTKNPYIGRMASTGINELSQVAMDDGSVAINVVAGYDFYIFEKIKKN